MEITIEGWGRGTAVVELAQEGEWVEATLEERVLRPTWPTSRYAADAMFHLRNAESLRRLKGLVEGRVGAGAAVGALSPATHWLDLPDYRAVLDSQSLGYLAVESKTGPHVTPVAYSVHNGRVWVASSRKSLKAKRAAGESKAGFLVRGDGRAFIAAGDFDVVDPFAPWSMLARPERTLLSSVLLDYARTNLGRIADYAKNGGIHPKVLVDTVFICLAPTRVCLLEEGDVVDRRGSWNGMAASSHFASSFAEGPGVVLSDEVPDDIEDLMDEERVHAVVGWQTPDGPLTLPGRWHGSRSLASVPSPLLQIAGISGQAPASICLDDDSDPDMGNKKGILLRGTGTIKPGNPYSAIAFDLDKATYWRGRDGGSSEASSSAS